MAEAAAGAENAVAGTGDAADDANSGLNNVADGAKNAG